MGAGALAGVVEPLGGWVLHPASRPAGRPIALRARITGVVSHGRLASPRGHGYDVAVSASAAYFKEQTRQAALRMTVEERILRALALGQSDLEFFASARGMTVVEARAILRERRAQERARGQRRPER